MFFNSLVKTCKDNYKLLIMSRVTCSDEFFIKRLSARNKKRKRKRKKEKKERSYSLH